MITAQNDADGKKRPGRPPLSIVDKQRRLVSRLSAACTELEQRLTEQAQLFDLIRINFDRLSALLETLHERLNLARRIAQAEFTKNASEAKKYHSKLNSSRPLGITRSEWDFLVHEQFIAPGKPSLALELEYARLEVKRIHEERKLLDLEASDGSDVRAKGPQDSVPLPKNVGRPSSGHLGKLDRQLHTSLYQKRNLLRIERSKTQPSPPSSRGRPPLQLEKRIARLDDVIETCRALIADAESSLSTDELQRRLLKRLRDAASRVRLSTRQLTGSALVLQQTLLQRLEDNITIEASVLKQISAGELGMNIPQRELRATILEKNAAFDNDLCAKTVVEHYKA